MTMAVFFMAVGDGMVECRRASLGDAGLHMHEDPRGGSDCEESEKTFFMEHRRSLVACRGQSSSPF